MTKQNRAMKMLYQYVRLEQIHSLAQCPDRWCFPLRLLLGLKKVDLHRELYILPIESLLN
jgi:hypothetical protein